jgi:hypothetical protein
MKSQRSRLAITRNRAIDETRIIGGQRLVVQAQLFASARFEILDKRVCAAGHLRDDRPAFRRFQINSQAVLVAVGAQPLLRLRPRRDQAGPPLMGKRPIVGHQQITAVFLLGLVEGGAIKLPMQVHNLRRRFIDRHVHQMTNF